MIGYARLALVAVPLLALACATTTTVSKQAKTGVAAVGRWRVEGELAGRDDISGIACADPNSSAGCLIASDELRSVQCVRLHPDQRRMTVGRSIELFATGDEFDAEGVTYGGGHYYVIGSHALSRKERLQENRFHLVRVNASVCTKPSTTALPGADFTSLSEAIEGIDMLKPRLRAPLTSGGINIEGIAVVTDRVYVGFRSPSIGGRVPVMSLSTTGPALEGSQTSLDWLELGEDVGVRDLERVSDGVLVLTGNASIDTDPKHERRLAATIAHWDLRSPKPTLLGTLPPTSGKPEAIQLLEESALSYRLLIFEDSAANGRPTEYTVTKPTRP